MAKKILHKIGKKKQTKKRFTFLKLSLAGVLLLLLLFTVFQLQQKQTLQEQAASATCGQPGDKGNEMGVGKYCTQGGGQCLGTGSPICSADIQLNGQGICSKGCNTDADCGTGATCFQDTLGKGCKPDVCDSNPPTATPKPTTPPPPTAVPTIKPMPTSAPATPVPTQTSVPTQIQIVPTISAQSTVIQMSVSLHGIGSSGDNRNQTSTLSNKTPVHPQRSFTIILTDNQNVIIATKQVIFTYSQTQGLFTGTVDLGDSFATDTYSITVSTASYVKKTIPGIQIIQGKQASIAALTLTAGDVNNDGALNMLDYNSIIACFSELSQPQSCTDAQKQAADLNDDGKVDQTDYNLFLREVSVSVP